MLGSTLILILTMIGQAPPGADGPALSPPPPGVVKSWLLTTHPLTHQSTLVLGWMRDGKVTVNPAEYPTFVVVAPKSEATPAPAPASAAGAAHRIPTGVVTDKLPQVRPGAPAWYGGNIPVGDGDTTHRTLAPGKAEVFLTVIGDKQARNTVVRNLNADPDFKILAAEMGDRLAVNAYGPENSIVKNVNLPAGGRPDVVIQDATGKELARYSSDPGPSTIVKEIRKADPNYRPGLGSDPLQGSDWPLYVGAAACIAIIIGHANRKAPLS